MTIVEKKQKEGEISCTASVSHPSDTGPREVYQSQRRRFSPGVRSLGVSVVVGIFKEQQQRLLTFRNWSVTQFLVTGPQVDLGPIPVNRQQKRVEEER